MLGHAYFEGCYLGEAELNGRHYPACNVFEERGSDIHLNSGQAEYFGVANCVGGIVGCNGFVERGRKTYVNGKAIARQTFLRDYAVESVESYIF